MRSTKHKEDWHSKNKNPLERKSSFPIRISQRPEYVQCTMQHYNGKAREYVKHIHIMDSFSHTYLP